MKMFENISGEKSGEWTISRKNATTVRSRRLGRKTTEEIEKGNQMVVPRFHMGGGISDIPGLPSGGLTGAWGKQKQAGPTKA